MVRVPVLFQGVSRKSSNLVNVTGRPTGFQVLPVSANRTRRNAKASAPKMAKQALTWAHTVPSSRQRNEKVIRLLRAEDAGWGVTESQSAFVYPHSLRPLRKIAGLETGSSDGNGTRVSELLEEAFPREQAEEEKDEASNGKDPTIDGTPKVYQSERCRRCALEESLRVAASPQPGMQETE